MLKGYAEGWIKLHVDSTFSFKDAAKAHEHIEQRKNIGKVILVP
ncbi:zinc-binding dehydrogenase [Oleiphilus sp. HI0061]